MTADILKDLQERISGFTAGPQQESTGVVREIGDGVARIEGLRNVRLSEMLDFGDGTVGLALNLEEHEVGAVILGEFGSIREGREVRNDSGEGV